MRVKGKRKIRNEEPRQFKKEPRDTGIGILGGTKKEGTRVRRELGKRTPQGTRLPGEQVSPDPSVRPLGRRPAQERVRRVPQKLHHLETPPRASYLCAARALPACQGHVCRHFPRGGSLAPLPGTGNLSSSLCSLRGGSDYQPIRTWGKHS